MILHNISNLKFNAENQIYVLFKFLLGMLSKKKSRPITVDEKKYRWSISPDSGYVVFVAENADNPARKIEVYIETDIDKMWLEFPQGNNLKLKIIKPKDATSIIRQAVNLGWDSTERGKPLVFYYYANGNIEIRNDG